MNSLYVLIFCIFLQFLSGSFCQAKDGEAIARNRRLWEEYKSSFIQADGRLVDKGQNSISHSEGQGYGMLISLFNDDRETFDRLWRWTRDNLRARKDGLCAWSWGKRGNGSWGVTDYNNATDGDILIAYALIKASEKWGGGEYRNEAAKIAAEIRKLLFITREGRTFLLPAYYGFESGETLTLNPSYLVFPAYRAFSGVDDKSFWDKVYADARHLMTKSLFGRFKLPPDWISLTRSDFTVAGGRKPLFGYEAIRTVLYLSWDTNLAPPEGIRELFKIYEKSGYIPAHVDVLDDEISLTPASAGFYAVYAFAARRFGFQELSGKLLTEALKKAAVEKGDYYSMSLLLLAVNVGNL